MVNAILGPTNTGKTHIALEKMISYPTGMIGLPLRLLAREVYEKLVEKVGVKNVSLVTGEEKIKPKNARYTVATVEAMPLDITPAFVCIDEIQLASDLERGHIFTDRLLNVRGLTETLFLGSPIIEPLLKSLIPQINITTRPRLSNLSFSGHKKITRLPRRTAIVAFSANEVYEIAELVRRQHGGAAVVMGALSPRTRNAQVALYQSGEVDYLIATDAIGMGLNLNVEHVAFAGERKFDGFHYRKLFANEFAQIAGRAGRFTTDGTFGTTGRCPAFDEELIATLEDHVFQPVKQLQWRNRALDFSSLYALRASLDVTPNHPFLTRAPLADDQKVLEAAMHRLDIKTLCKDSETIELLWKCCLIPDFRKVSPQAHIDLCLSLFTQLAEQRFIDDKFIEKEVKECEFFTGDIDSLSFRLAKIRYWTYVAQKPFWLRRQKFWQTETRRIEDALSDALHEKLMARFIDKRTSILMRRLREKAMLEVKIEKTGEIFVEEQNVGRLEGFSFTPDLSASGIDLKTLKSAAASVLSLEIARRAERLANANDDAFILTSNNYVRFQGEVVARVSKGSDALNPVLSVISDEHLAGSDKENVVARLDYWFKAQIRKHLGPLLDLEAAEGLAGIAKGLAFQLKEQFGVIDRLKVLGDVKNLDQEGRTVLRKNGVRFGAYHIFVPFLLKPYPRALALQLWALYNEKDEKGVTDLPTLLLAGRTSLPRDAEISDEAYRIAGMRAFETKAIRVDILERVADIIRPALMWKEGGELAKPENAVKGGFIVTQSMISLAGSTNEDFASILKALGYKSEKRELTAEELPTTVVAVVVEGEAPAVVEGETPAVVEETPVESVAETTPPSEPKLVEVWQHGRFNQGERKPYVKKVFEKTFEKKPYVKRDFKPKTEGEAGEASSQGEKRVEKFKKFNKDFKKPEGDKANSDKKPFDKKANNYKNSKPDFKKFEKPPAKEKPIDMNSPFAKLLALKESMSSK